MMKNHAAKVAAATLLMCLPAVGMASSPAHAVGVPGSSCDVWANAPQVGSGWVSGTVVIQCNLFDGQPVYEAQRSGAQMRASQGWSGWGYSEIGNGNRWQLSAQAGMTCGGGGNFDTYGFGRATNEQVVYVESGYYDKWC